MILVQLATLAAAGLGATTAWAEDWPTYLHDNRRSGVTAESLPLPLEPAWVYRPTHPPAPAWPAPAGQDYWHNTRDLEHAVTYDRAFHVAVVGDRVYFGSSADDKVICLDGGTGQPRWTFFAQGPVRLAPAVSQGRVYVGSDDGRVYCLDAADGRLQWKVFGAGKDYQLPAHGRMTSLWPIRTGVLVDGETVYAGAGLFPTQDTFLFALDAKTGKPRWRKKIDVSPQGYLLGSAARLFVPTGRTSPAIFEGRDGKKIGDLNLPGGSFTVLASDLLINGPGRRSGTIGFSDVDTRETIATFDGLEILVHEGTAYLLSHTELSAFDRGRYVKLARDRNALTGRRKQFAKQLGEAKKQNDKPLQEKLTHELQQVEVRLGALAEAMQKCFLWRQPCTYRYSMILAGDLLFAGGEGRVAAFNRTDGRESWTAHVRGRVYGLAVANGKLFVSTDAGLIYCFTRSTGEDGTSPRTVQPVRRPEPYPDDGHAATYARAARRIVEQTDITQGYCLVLGCGEGRLAYELAKITELTVIGIEPDARKVAVAREALDGAGHQGRVAVHHGALTKLPYVPYFANLIVSDHTLVTGKLVGSADEVFRVLRPWGGVLYLGQLEDSVAGGAKLTRADVTRWLGDTPVGDWDFGQDAGRWLTLRRGPLPDTGEWTHLYANPSNTTCSGEKRTGSELAVQWFGQPGPRTIVDRHHRPMSPLFKNGRVFVPANNRVIALDAYNGSHLWEKEVTGSRRLGVMNDTGQMLVADDHLYVVAKHQCLALDVATGQRRRTLETPQVVPDQIHHWGYVAHVGDQLFGSGQKPAASLDYFDFGGGTIGQIEGDFVLKAASDFLFSLERTTGRVLWT